LGEREALEASSFSDRPPLYLEAIEATCFNKTPKGIEEELEEEEKAELEESETELLELEALELDAVGEEHPTMKMEAVRRSAIWLLFISFPFAFNDSLITLPK
jgi:L-fucose isomerase-like protein